MPEREIPEENRTVRRLRRRLRDKEQEIAQLWAKLSEADVGAGGLRPESIIWVFGTGRSGSTWLGSMLGELGAMWNEPLVGALFGEFYYERAAHKRGGPAILGNAHRGLWLSQIRRIVLEGAAARYPELSGYLTIKEPHGSTGAPLLSAAIPESRLVFLVRDPRDVAASAMDARREGGWARKTAAARGMRGGTVGNPDAFVAQRAETWLRDIGKAHEAHEAHEGPKALVRYEDLVVDTLGEMRRVHRELGIASDERGLVAAVEKYSWERIPEEEKGEGEFYRKGTPGSWREDLTPEQARTVEEITAPLLDEFYPEEARA